MQPTPEADAFHSFKEQLAVEMFNRDYENLTETEQEAVINGVWERRP